MTDFLLVAYFFGHLVYAMIYALFVRRNEYSSR